MPRRPRDPVRTLRISGYAWYAAALVVAVLAITTHRTGQSWGPALIITVAWLVLGTMAFVKRRQMIGGADTRR
jgi:hypothetical protein